MYACTPEPESNFSGGASVMNRHSLLKTHYLNRGDQAISVGYFSGCHQTSIERTHTLWGRGAFRLATRERSHATTHTRRKSSGRLRDQRSGGRLHPAMVLAEHESPRRPVV